MAAEAQTTPAARPHLDERAEYVPRADQERFIVPLLKRAIEAHLAAHAIVGNPADEAVVHATLEDEVFD